MIKRTGVLCGLTMMFAIDGMSYEKVVSSEQNKSLSADYQSLLEKIAPFLDDHITLFNQSFDADNPQKGKIFFDRAIECLEEIQKIIYSGTHEQLKIDLRAHLGWVYFKFARSTSDRVLKETYVDYAGMLSVQTIKETLIKELLACPNKAAADKGHLEA